MKDLREFIKLLEEREQLVRIGHQVSAHLEITEITDRICKSPAEQNKALLFENVTGSDLPVLINAFGNRERMSWALGVDDFDRQEPGVLQYSRYCLLCASGAKISGQWQWNPGLEHGIPDL